MIEKNKKIYTHGACEQCLCNQNSKQTAHSVDSGANKHNGNVVEASRRFFITNNDATSNYEIPWQHDAWRHCSTSCNCNGSISSPFGCSYYMTRYDASRTTTSLSMSDATTTVKEIRGVFDGNDKIKWEHHQYKNDATTAKKHANDIIFSNRCL